MIVCVLCFALGVTDEIPADLVMRIQSREVSAPVGSEFEAQILIRDRLADHKDWPRLLWSFGILWLEYDSQQLAFQEVRLPEGAAVIPTVHVFDEKPGLMVLSFRTAFHPDPDRYSLIGQGPEQGWVSLGTLVFGRAAGDGPRNQETEIRIPGWGPKAIDFLEPTVWFYGERVRFSNEMTLLPGTVRFTEPFLRADVDGNGTVEESDALATLRHLFGTSDEVACKDAADANDDGVLNVSDVIYLLNFVFRGGAAPEPPFREEGVDPTFDGLGCEQ